MDDNVLDRVRDLVTREYPALPWTVRLETDSIRDKTVVVQTVRGPYAAQVRMPLRNLERHPGPAGRVILRHIARQMAGSTLRYGGEG